MPAYVSVLSRVLFAAFRHSISVIDYVDNSIITWILTLVCAPHLIKNPYITAKLIEVLFVTSPTIQTTSQLLYLRVSCGSVSLCVSLKAINGSGSLLLDR